MNLLSDLGERLAAAVLAACTYSDFGKNQPIVTAGSMPTGIYILKSGLAGVFAVTPDGESLIVPVVPGTVFETRLDRRRPSTMTIRALAPTKAMHLSEEKFAEFCLQGEFVEWCSANLYRNLTAFTVVGAAAVQKTTDRKIHAFVRAYLESALGRPPLEAETAEWLLTQSHVSDILGITRTHLNARLSAMAREGSVDIRRRQVHWCQPSQEKADA